MQLLIFLFLLIVLFFLSRILTKSVSALLVKGFGENKFSFHFFHLLFLPGVIIHELAHFITAKILFVNTGNFNLSPRREGDSVIMGSVGIEKTDPVRRALIGFAPVFFGTSLIILFATLFLSEFLPFPDFINYLIIFLIMFQIGNTMFSSKKDLEGTLEILLVVFIFLIVFFILGFRIPEDVILALNSNYVNDLIQKVNLILLIPIVINLLIIFIIRFLIKTKDY